MKILVIPDIHGRDTWKYFGDLKHLCKLPHLETEYNKYIFLGDYVDSFTISNAKILSNLKEIIQLKKYYPEHVVLLLGNHDLQYMFSSRYHGCSGYRPETYAELHNLFNKEKSLFESIYQIENYLFSHAGITSVWWNKFISNLKENGIEYSKETSIADIITDQFKSYNAYLFDVGVIRSGRNKSGGPFWADKTETMAWPLPNYIQIVGHTPIKKIIAHQTNIYNSRIIYTDCITNSYELEI